MKSLEQIGGSPKQLKEWSRKGKEEASKKPERKITTLEESAEMTRQRRKDFGLKEVRELTPEEAENLERNIKKLLKSLDQYDFTSYSSKIKEDWYWAEIEAETGKDRELAEAILKKFLKVLQKESEKTGK